MYLAAAVSGHQKRDYSQENIGTVLLLRVLCKAGDWGGRVSQKVLQRDEMLENKDLRCQKALQCQGGFRAEIGCARAGSRQGCESSRGPWVGLT